MSVDQDLGKVIGKLEGIEQLLIMQQKSTDQDRFDNRREHKVLFDHMNYVNKEISPIVEEVESHVLNHLSWLKIGGIGIAFLAGIIALVDRLTPALFKIFGRAQ